MLLNTLVHERQTLYLSGYHYRYAFKSSLNWLAPCKASLFHRPSSCLKYIHPSQPPAIYFANVTTEVICGCVCILSSKGAAVKTRSTPCSGGYQCNAIATTSTTQLHQPYLFFRLDKKVSDARALFYNLVQIL